MCAETSEYQQHLEIMREIPYFSTLDLEAQKLIAYLCVREKFGPGDEVFATGDIDQSAYYIISGEMEAFLDLDGSKIQSFKGGDFVGALSLIGDSKRLFTLKTVSECTCIRLTSDKFKKAQEQYPEISSKFLKATVDMISHWEERFIANYNNGCTGCKAGIGLTLI
ncbi:Crp/Fnr family transcriptional regulator [Maridesulfovibrio hydrothermalis]|uniref:Putative transcriptional regulator, Crp/Fnr family n=1 Tax=Maridesulfovibrio hydrothermalis AM13 = DSM 14728 TaxID=1121451 RepID=L0R614_9BACT|nr:cyclic nucleotide-binding domain-containing protein [Maridesulfovibrio hydrothermalis]CCO22119.1 putative transcriptional regulator, Crp/Fnr family [Maridesulfovibrio hydrothermalis AM13 = DSM 14728]